MEKTLREGMSVSQTFSRQFFCMKIFCSLELENSWGKICKKNLRQTSKIFVTLNCFYEAIINGKIGNLLFLQ